MGLRRRPRSNKKRTQLGDRLNVKKKNIFDNFKSTEKIMSAAVKESIEQLKEVKISINPEARSANMTLYDVDTPFKIGMKLGEGSFGSIYSLSGELQGMVIKVVEYDEEESENFEDWFVRIVSEGALMRIFSAVGAGAKTPPVSMGMSEDLRVAFFIMEQMSGSVDDLFEDLLYSGSYHKYKSTISKQIRYLISSAVKIGIACTDMKPENMLYKIVNRKPVIVLADFDTEFCCALADSVARKQLEGVKMKVPVTTPLTSHWININAILLSDSIPETGALCPRNKNKYKTQIIKVTLGMIGFMMDLFPAERAYAKRYLNDRRNKGEYVYDMFKIRWDHYKPAFYVS